MTTVVAAYLTNWTFTGWEDVPLEFLQHLRWSAVVFGSMFLCIWLGFRVAPSEGRARLAVLGAVCLLAGAVGFLLRSLDVLQIEAWWRMSPSTDWRFLYYLWQFHTALAILVVALLELTERGRRAADAQHAAELRQLALQRESAQARLQLLQAQIEPHFLFNSLANVRRLLRTDTPAAASMLVDLMRYLEEALPRLREEHTTLGREADLVRAFLAVHQVRMAGRLRAEVKVPPELRKCAVPPMALLSLVENALKHGLQPLVEGGAIHVGASAADGILTLTVADTGAGMGSGSGHGTGLANLRAQLKAMHGSAAHLSLRLIEPHGVAAVITLPERT